MKKMNYPLAAIAAAAFITLMLVLASCSRTCGPPSHQMDWEWIQKQKQYDVYKSK